MCTSQLVNGLTKSLFAVFLSAAFVSVGCDRGETTSNSDEGTLDNVAQGGKGSQADEQTIRSAADLAAGGLQPDVGAEVFSPQTTPLPDSADRPDPRTMTRTDAAGATTPAAPPDTPIGFELTETTPTPAGVADPNGSPSSAATGVRPLRDGLTAEELAKFLEDSDRDMQLLASGRSNIIDPREASEMMRTLAKTKLQAAVKLQNHAESTKEQRTEGMRGQLQALSHLSAMGDLASAKALESLAKDNLDSEESMIAGDSRIVLIGFAIDALRAGEESAADEIVALIEGMKSNTNPDVPAVLMMAEARQTLASYGMIDQAAKVRAKILALYGNSSDPMIAQVAADAAGTAKFDSGQRLLNAILKNETVALSRWSDAVMQLINDSPDINTVQFLATAALQLEAAGRDAFVQETFAILSEQFTDSDSAAATEIETAKEAMEARRDVIGTKLDFAALPSVDGKGVSPSDYQGKVVLMPFWAIVVPESLQIINLLQQIQSEHPDQIAIVGMNLDPEQAPLREFLAKNPLPFPSYRSVSSATRQVANPVAAKFGLVSMPFVAVFNQQGNVEALDFTGTRIESIVDELIPTKE